MRILSIATMLGLSLSAAVPAVADPAPNNTAQNKNAKPTADDSGKTGSDLQLTKQIRKAIMADHRLSTSAHNCKVVVKDGQVTLLGPVKDEDERVRIEDLAVSVVGDKSRVTNQLQISR